MADTTTLVDANTRRIYRPRRPLSASAKAKSDCLLLVIRQASFHRILSKQFDVTESLLKILVRRIREQSAQIQNQNENSN